MWLLRVRPTRKKKEIILNARGRFFLNLVKEEQEEDFVSLPLYEVQGKSSLSLDQSAVTFRMNEKHFLVRGHEKAFHYLK